MASAEKETQNQAVEANLAEAKTTKCLIMGNNCIIASVNKVDSSTYNDKW